MELRLTADELALLHEILKAWHQEFEKHLQQASDQQLQRELQQSHACVKGLLSNLLARRLEFDFEELDDLSRLLADSDSEFAAGVARQDDPERKRAMQGKQLVLKSLRDKVSEACVML